MAASHPITLAVELRRAGKRYGELAVVKDVDLTIEQGKTFCFIGPSGCGKSTTMKMINRLIEPSDGSILVNGKDVRSMDAAELRRGIGYVIQDVGLFPHYTVSRNVGLVPELLGWSTAKRKARVEELLDVVGLPEPTFGARFPRQLSGGQRQRAGIARALAADPPIVLLDEPFSALDPITRERLQDEFIALSQRLGKTFVIVTHDILEAVRLADCIGVMREGRLVQIGAPRDIVLHPADDGVAALLGRNRYRLRLMTIPLAEVCSDRGHVGEPPPVPPSDVVALPDTASAWEALDKMEMLRAKWLRIDGGGSNRERWVTRGDLLGALGD